LTTIRLAVQDVIFAGVAPNRTVPRLAKWLPTIVILVPAWPRPGDTLLMCGRAGVRAVTVME
jgi:hypothetical protein